MIKHFRPLRSPPFRSCSIFEKYKFDFLSLKNRKNQFRNEEKEKGKKTYAAANQRRMLWSLSPASRHRTSFASFVNVFCPLPEPMLHLYSVSSICSIQTGKRTKKGATSLDMKLHFMYFIISRTFSLSPLLSNGIVYSRDAFFRFCTVAISPHHIFPLKRPSPAISARNNLI